ncbi:MAG: hypothetical protein ACK4NS_03990 [Saprospiraceae bacterium]
MTFGVQISCLFFCCACALPLAAQSPWSRSKAGAYAQVSYHQIGPYSRRYADDGALFDLPRSIRESAVQLYAEYGLDRRNTLIITGAWRSQRSGAPTGGLPPSLQAARLSGPGPLSVAWKRQWIAGRVALASALRIETPVGRYDEASGLRSGYPTWAIAPSLSAGWGGDRAYGYLYTGMQQRGRGYSAQYFAGMEAGAKVRSIWLAAAAEWMRPLDNGGYTAPAANQITGLYVNNQGWMAVGIKVAVPLNPFVGITLALNGAISGRNAPASPLYAAGFYFDWP